MDASNAFNNLNHCLALANILSLCPAFSQVIIIHTYHNAAKFFVGGETILSQEGTTQGDLVGMAMVRFSFGPFHYTIEQYC